MPSYSLLERRPAEMKTGKGGCSLEKPEMRLTVTISHLPVCEETLSALQMLSDACRPLRAASLIPVERQTKPSWLPAPRHISIQNWNGEDIGSLYLFHWDLLLVEPSSENPLISNSDTASPLILLGGSQPSPCITPPSASTSPRECSTSEPIGTDSDDTSKDLSESNVIRSPNRTTEK